MPERRWISPKECAGYLSLHLISVYRLIDKGLIPATRIGRSIRIDMKKLDAQLEGRRD